MNKIPFDEKELEIIGEIEDPWFEGGKVYRYNHPITIKENYYRFFRDKHPMWLPLIGSDVKDFNPKVIPDNIARAFVMEAEPFDNEHMSGGPDMYGVIWEYIPAAHGSMVRPGHPIMEDVNDWKSIIKRPDIDSWDWEGSAKANKEWLDSTDDVIEMQLLSGAWFERLISFMDFEAAAMALIDEDQEDALHELFDATTEDLCKIIDKIAEYFPQVDSISVHDDWGAQSKPFFSMDAAMDMIVPHMKKLTDHIHEKGMIASLHSCGNTETRTPAYIAAGWDYWQPQQMNDIPQVYEDYGDKITIGVQPKVIPEDMSGKEMAQYLMDHFVKPGKLGIPSYYIPYSQELDEELYRLSRQYFLKME